MSGMITTHHITTLKTMRHLSIIRGIFLLLLGRYWRYTGWNLWRGHLWTNKSTGRWELWTVTSWKWKVRCCRDRQAKTEWTGNFTCQGYGPEKNSLETNLSKWLKDNLELRLTINYCKTLWSSRIWCRRSFTVIEKPLYIFWLILK